MMKTFYTKNLSSSDMTLMPCDPWFVTSKGYPANVSNKEDYEKWVRDKSTDHCFYTAAEGINPHKRISLENPAKWLHGLVADYDAKLDPNFNVQDIISRCDPDALPAAISRTFSGNARVVWEFDCPLMVDCPEMNKLLMKELGKKFKLGNVLPGIDECTFRLNQLFEIGHGWVQVPGNPSVSDTVLGDIIVRAGGKVDWNKVANTDVEIPMDRIAAEVEARWPGAWPGDFTVGSRGPTFWLNDGITRIGCQVAEAGIICYTDRAGKSFMTWADLLGKQFVDQYRQEVIGKAVMEYYYDGRAYWFKNGTDRWYDAKVENVARSLRVHGIKTDSKKGASQMDRVIHAIETQRRVDAAAPILFDSREIVDIGNTRILNINYRTAIAPAESGDESHWKWLKEWIWPCFGEEQLPYWLAYWKRKYMAALNYEQVQSQLIVLAGGPAQGKTLLNRKVMGDSIGGWADAAPYLQGKTNFNKTIAEHPHWVVDDPQTSIDLDRHRQFSESLKSHVANPTVIYHPKFKDATELPWTGCMCLTVNTDAHSLSVLPTLDNNILDKIMLFQFEPHQHKFYSNKETEGIIRKELPYFLRWLIDYTPPVHVLWPENPRFGIRPYHHPRMVESANEDSAATKLEEILDRWASSIRRDDKAKKEWKGTATDMFSGIMGVDEGMLKPLLSRYTPVRLGRELRMLANRPSSRVLRHVTHHGKTWYIISVEETVPKKK
jgi:hypothetical protein